MQQYTRKVRGGKADPLGICRNLIGDTVGYIQHMPTSTSAELQPRRKTSQVATNLFPQTSDEYLLCLEPAIA